MYLDDETFLAQFNDRSLNPEHFDHRAHLRMAWLLLKLYSFEEATRRVCEGIQELATQFGAPDKYHLTLTKAIMHIMHLRMEQVKCTDFEHFLRHNPDLVLDTRKLLAYHYSDNVLNSPEARGAWVEPDIAPIRKQG